MNLVEVLIGVFEKLKDEKGNVCKFFFFGVMDNVVIIVDEQINFLVIIVDQFVQEKFVMVIVCLDICCVQVLVEVIIVEVQDGNGLNFGV